MRRKIKKRTGRSEMAVSVFNNRITMTRANTVVIPLKIIDADGFEYTPDPEDVISFAMKASYFDDETVLTKFIPYNDLFLRLAPGDTIALPEPSSYVYDITIHFSDGTVDTIIANGRLDITELALSSNEVLPR